jgi:RNA polymerase sigma factor (sigma-70 family)
MQTAQDYDSQTDEQLIALAAAGDQSAFAAFFERYFDGVYDFAIRMTREPNASAAAVYGTFAEAWDGLQRGRGGGRLKAWLYAIARDRAIIESRRGRRTSGNGTAPQGPETPSYATPDPARLATPAVVEDNELAQTVWSAAATLTPRQYALLDMHLRRGLTAEQIAEGLQIPQANAYTMLTRLRNGLYEAVTYQLLMTRGRRECADLDSLLTHMRATELTRRSQLAIRNHLKTCGGCRENRRKYPSPLAVFAGLGLIPADPADKIHVWQNVSAHIQGITRRKPFIRRAVPLAHVEDRSSMPYLAAAAGAIVALLAILLAGVLVLTSGGGGSTLKDPENVRPLDRELGDSSTDNVIEVVWDVQNYVQAYSVTWSEDPNEVPDTNADLAGSTTRTESPELDPGIWYFHLRTQGTDGSWTSTVQLGPFEVLEDSPTPTPASPTPTEKPTPVVTPNFGTPQPTPTPPPTPEPTPAPTAPPTPAPTPTPTPILPTLTPVLPTPSDTPL